MMVLPHRRLSSLSCRHATHQAWRYRERTVLPCLHVAGGEAAGLRPVALSLQLRLCLPCSWRRGCRSAAAR